MQSQKDDAMVAIRDIFRVKRPLTHKFMTFFRLRAMHGAHCGHAGTPIASQLQHGYLPVIEGE
jgi:hypothetical protein